MVDADFSALLYKRVEVNRLGRKEVIVARHLVAKHGESTEYGANVVVILRQSNVGPLSTVEASTKPRARCLAFEAGQKIE